MAKIVINSNSVGEVYYTKSVFCAVVEFVACYGLNEWRKVYEIRCINF